MQFSIGVTPAAVIREGLGVYPVLGKPIHLPRLAEEAASPAILWTLTLVMRHCLRPHVCHLGGDADCLGIIRPARARCFLRHLRCDALKTEAICAANLVTAPGLKAGFRSGACLLHGIFGLEA